MLAVVSCMLARSCSFMELHRQHRPLELLANFKWSCDLDYIKCIGTLCFVVWFIRVSAHLIGGHMECGVSHRNVGKQDLGRGNIPK